MVALKLLQISVVPFVFFVVHAVLSHTYYNSCRSNIFAIFLYENARSCFLMENAMQVIEKAMWCYAIAAVKDLKAIVAWMYAPHPNSDAGTVADNMRPPPATDAARGKQMQKQKQMQKEESIAAVVDAVVLGHGDVLGVHRATAKEAYRQNHQPQHRFSISSDTDDDACSGVTHIATSHVTSARVKTRTASLRAPS